MADPHEPRQRPTTPRARPLGMPDVPPPALEGASGVSGAGHTPLPAAVLGPRPSQPELAGDEPEP